MIKPTWLPVVALGAVFALCALTAGAGTGRISLEMKQTAVLTGLHVSGNNLLDGANNHIRFQGVNRSGTEYACIQGWGIFDGPSDAASVAAIASWHVNAVRVLLNEDCWLGINGVPAADGGANYIAAIVAFVNLLNANGIYVELSLIWGAPGTTPATNQPAAPDEDHSPAFWTSVANTFKSNPNVVFGVWGETTVSWACFLNGCSNEAGYTTAGTQLLVNNIRATGATQVISVPCINYANDCYDDATHNWLSNEPSDSLHSIIAEAHIYGKNTCDTTSCFDSTLATTAATVPMIFGETGETYDDSDCGSSFISTFMTWADAHNVGYLAWTWDTWGTCGALISNYNGTPANAFGSWVQSHYAATPPPPPACSGTPLFTSYFSWFDKASAGMLNDNIHLLNTGASTSTGCVVLGSQAVAFSVPAGKESYLSFPAGNIGGPVVVNVLSGPAVLASQRVQYYQSFNEVWAMSPAQAAKTSYLSWFDKASPGMYGDNIHVLNPGASTANVTVSMPGASPLNFALAPGAETYASFPSGTIGGPVTISADQAVLASQRVQYYQTFNEVVARSAAQATTTSYFNWFDKASTGFLNDNIHLLNTSASTAHVTVSLPGASSVPATLAAGAEGYVTFPAGKIGGPVSITSDQPLLASQRVQYYQSFNETPSESAAQALTTSHIMWFDKASTGMVGDNIHVLNLSASTANVTVSIPGAAAKAFALPAGQETYVTFPAGNIGGPVSITSDQAVLAAQRVQYYQTFNEVSSA